MASKTSENTKQNIVIDKNGNLKLINVGEALLPGEIIIENESGNVSVEVADSPDKNNDINEILNAISDGEDPSLVTEAPAAGEDSGSSLTASTEIERIGKSTVAETNFDTSSLEGIGLSRTQSLTLLEQYKVYRDTGEFQVPDPSNGDSTAPNAPSIELDNDRGKLGNDLLTNDGSFTVTPSETGNTVEYKAADGTWSTTAPTVVEGNNSIIVREVDGAGNASGETQLDFVLDTTAPNAPTIILDTDSGISDGDLLTNDGSFTVTPSEAGNTVEYKAADGTWSTTPPAVAEGSNSIIVREVDGAGNASGETQLDFVLDTTAPNAPTIILDTDSGISNGDLLTNDGSFTVTPSEAGNTVEYKAADGTWSTTPPAVAEGANSIIVREVDGAGNASGETQLDFVLDTTAPNAPTIILDTDSGISNGDLLTNDGSFTVTPSEAGNTVEYKAADGSWSTTPPAVAEGSNSIIVREVDKAGNASGETQLDFVLDTTAPNAPSIALDVDSGISNGDLLTNDGSFTVTPSEAGNTVEYKAADGSWSTTPPAVAEGSNSIIVREVDGAGNASGETQLDFVLDTTAPNAPTIILDTDSGISDGDLLTNDGSFTVTPSEAGNTVEYKAADGTWSTTPPAVAEGSNSIIVREVDKAGNASGETQLDFVLDTTAPNAPTIILDTDSGISNGDLLTNDGSFTVTPSEAGNTVEYKAADGTWSTTPAVAAEGNNSIIVREVDGAGNASGETQLDFVLDTTAPNAPSIALDVDSGISNGDLLTNDGSFTVTPSEAGNTVEYKAADGSWSTTPPAVAEGSNSIIVREVDGAGNASGETQLDFVLDTTAPNAPTIILDTDSGISDGDLLTNDGSFTVTPSEADNSVEYKTADGTWSTTAPTVVEGNNSIVVREVDGAGNASGETQLDFVLDTTAPNAPSIELDNDSGKLGNDLLTNDGSFTVTPSEAGNTVEYKAADGSWSTTPPAVAEGSNSIIVREVDGAGNASGETQLDFVLDTTAPNAPSIALDVDSGISNGDLLTNDGSFTVTPSEAGNTVEYKAADGTWSTTPAVAAEGNNSIIVREVDGAGNASGETQLDFVLDTTAPNAPSIVLDVDSGISNGDLLTNDGSFTVTPSEAGNTVEYKAADGSWSTTPPAVAEGSNSIIVREVDGAGNASGETQLDFVLDTTAPNAPTIILDTDSGISNGDLLTNDGSFTVTPSEAGNTVEYKAADGTWSTTPPAVAEGANSIIVREVDGAGNASGETQLDFVLDTTAPNAPTIILDTDSGISNGDLLTNDGSFTVTPSEAGNTVEYKAADGTWSTTLPVAAEGNNSIIVREVDGAGNASGETQLDFVLDTTAPNAPTIILDTDSGISDGDLLTNDGSFTVTPSEAGNTVEYKAADGTWSTTPPAVAEGSNSIIAREVDKAGNASGETQLDFVLDTTAPNAPTIILDTDSGISDGDLLTNDGSFTVTPSEADNSVEYKTADGTWSTTAPTVVEGNNSIVVREVDGAGNASGETQLDFVLDTTAPNAPSIELDNDSGKLGNDLLTNDGSFTVTPSEAGNTVEYKAADGSWSTTPPAVAEGSNSIIVREVDGAGNASGETQLDFVLDTTAPNAPTIILDTDSGISNGDLLTNDGSFTVTPSEAGNTVEYKAADGTWSTTPAVAAEGNNSIIVREVDGAGNASGETQLDFVLDTTAPNAPSIALDVDSGISNGDLLTNDGSFTVTPSEAGNTVEYKAADGTWSTTALTVVEGNNSVIVREVDGAGNASGETQLDFVLDTTAPNAPSIELDNDSGKLGNDLLTNDGSFTVTPSEAGNTVEYKAADGAWSTTPPAVAEGSNSIIVREVDDAGNVSGETQLDFVLDTTAPNAPSIALDVDSGISNGDLLTNDGSFTVTPSEAGNTVEYKAADGSWSTTPPAVAEGSNSIIVREVDGAGNASGETQLDFVLDTTAPNAPTIILDTDSGISDGDLLTNDGSFTVTPSEAGNTVEYKAADGTWSTTPPAVAEGSNSIIVREVDKAGNASGETQLDFVLDTTAPNAPTIILDTDSGISDGDLLTNDGSFTVTPSEAGNTVEYKAADGTWSTTAPTVVEGNNSIVVREVDGAGNASGETQLDFVLDTTAPNAPTIILDTDSGISNGDLLTNDGSFTVTPSEAGNTVEYKAADGSWSTTPPAVAEGSNSIIVREVDGAGNASGETQLDFVLDTTAPNAPTIILDTDSGISNGDLLTNDGSFTVTPSEAGNTVEYKAADGTWSTTPPVAAEGNNSIIVREVDGAGNASGETQLDFVLDTTAPNAPTIILDTDSGISDGDLLTNDGSFTVTPSEAGNTVEYKAADGTWSTPPPAVAEGSNSIIVREVDKAGNASGETQLDFVLDTTAPNAPTIILDTDSGISNGDLLTNDGSFTVTPSEAGNTVEYKAADGTWSTTPAVAAEGNNSIIVREVDGAGNASGETQLDFVLDTTAPNAPSIALDVDSGISNGDLLTNDGSFTVTPSEAGNTVEYKAADGSWSTTPPAVAEGSNSIIVREVDGAGNASGETQLDFVLDTTAPNAPTIILDTDSGISDGDLLTNDGSFTVTPSEADNSVEYKTADGTWSTTAPTVVEGNNSIVVREVDGAGNASGETQLDFVLDTTAPNAPSIELDNDSGKLGNDLLTNDGSFTVTPSEAGNTVEYKAADGSWSTTPPAVAEGSNSIIVREVDKAGNASGETQLDFVLDTTAPNAPSIALDVDSGISNGDLLTNDGSFTVTPSEAGNTVEYKAADGSWSTTPPAVAEGSNSIIVREVDKAGNASGETQLDFVLDTTAPNAPSIALDVDSGISNGDLLTNDGSFTVTPSEAGNTVEYKAADGTWSTTAPTVVEGNNSIIVREVDGAGNASGETQLDFVLDTTAPNAPSIALDVDSGISNGDLLTNDGSFTVTPSEAGNTVEYKAADGSWSTTPPAVAEGSNSIIVREVDGAGNASGETQLDFVLDTTAPNAPTIILDTDSGISNGDLLTNDGSFTVTPSEAGNTVEYKAADGSWSTTPPAVAEGSNSIIVREVDDAGNVSGETQLDFVLDTTAPNAPSIALDVDSGISNGDLLTNDGSFTVTPSEAGNTVEYKAADGSWSTTPPAVAEGSNSIIVREVDKAGNASGETQLDFVLDTTAPNAPTIILDTDSGISDGDLLTNDGSFTVTPSEAGNTVEYKAADGTWSTTPPAVAEGSNSIIVREVDGAGNASGETQLDFVLDTTAPNAPSIALDVDSGISNGDLLTNDGSFTVTPSEAGNTVEYKAADGSWSTTPPAVAEGSNSIIVREVDGAGNASGETQLDFVLDTTAPNAPTIILDTDSGISNGDLLTNDGSFTVTPSEAGNTVEYKAADGTWSTTLPVAAEGNNSIIVREVDGAGNASGETQLDFVLDTTAPNAPTIILDTDSGISNGDLLTNDGSFTVTPSEAGNTVEYKAADGTWSTTPPAVAEGSNSIIVREVDGAGNASGETQLDFVLDTTAPNAPTIILDTDSGISDGDLLTNDGSFTVTPSEADNSVEYKAADGSWSTTPPAVAEGSNSIIVREVDDAGNVSGETQLDFVLDTTAPNAPSIALDVDSGISNGDLLTNDGSFTVTPSEAGNTVEYKAADGSWSTTPPAVAEGSNSIIVREVDGAGNASGETQLDFVLDTTAPNAPTIILDTDSGISNGDLLTNDGSFTVTPSEAGNTVEYKAADGTWSTTPPAVAEGSNSIIVREVDKAGNASGETQLDFVLDTTAPNAPTIILDTDSGISNGDLLTNDGSFTVTPSEAGNTVEYKAADGTWSTTAPTVVEGNNSIVVREVDGAGNASGETQLDFVLDTTAPNAPTIILDTDSGISDGDLLTNDGSFTVTPSEAGNTVEYKAADGTWSTTAPTVVEGNNSIVVREVDGAGNVSGETQLDFVLDTTAPNSPSIELDNDSGKLGNDLLTNDGSFTVTPSETGNTVEYKAADGSWSTTPPAVAEGSNSIIVREVDKAGNASGETQLDFVLDTTAPNAPTIILDTDSGISDGDLLTNDGSFTVTPSEAGNTVEYKAADGTWSTTAPTVVEGNNSIVVREVDGAGNASGETQLDFVLDTTAPNAPSIALDVDSGISNGDLLTNDGSFTVTPSEAGNTVEYKAADGSWSTTPPAVAEGSNSIIVREVDKAGNASGETPLDFVLDTTAPNAPSIALDVDSGISNGDLLTNDGSFTVTPSEAGNTVEYKAADGSWSTTSPAVAEGSNSIIVREVDGAGNVSGETQLDFVLDTTVSTPAITNITDDSTASDYSTVTLLGTGEPGATITIYIEDNDGKTQQGTALVQSDGTWVSDFSGLDDMVNYQVTVEQTDEAGNTSEESDPIQYFNGDFAETDNLDDYALLGDGNDTFYLNDDDLNDRVVVDGGAGTDTAVLNSNLSDSQISVNEHGEIVIIDKDGDENIFRDFEEFQFKDDHKTVEELLTPEVTIIDDKNNNGILTKAELEGRVTATIVLPPAATAGMFLLITIDGQAEEYTLTQNDINAGSLTRETDAPASGNKVIISAEISLGDDKFVGSDEVTYLENSGPIAGDDSFSAQEDIPFVISLQDLLGNDSDLDNDSLSIISITNPSSGSAIINSDGDIEFTPAPNFSGDVTFDYTISDGKGGSDTAIVTINIDAVADTPSLTIATQSKTLLESSFEDQPEDDKKQFSSGVDGWTPIEGEDAIETWESGSDMSGGGTAYASDGDQFIELNSASSFDSAKGIERDIITQEDKLYTLTLDVAPRPGYDSKYNSFDIVVDGVVVGSWSGSSPENQGLDWNSIQVSFYGSSTPQNIQLVSTGKHHGSGRGVLIDNLIIEEHNGVQAGNEGSQTHIALSDYIDANLIDTDDSESLSYEIANLPSDAFIFVDGAYITPVDGKVTLNSEQLSDGKIVFNSNYTGAFTLAITAIATETSNGDTARSEPQFLELIIAEPGTNTDPIDTSKVQGGDFADQITKGSVQSITPGVHGQTYIIDDANVINSGAGNDHVASGAGNDIIHLGESHTAGYDESQSAYDQADEERALFATGSDASKLNGQDPDSFISGYSPIAHIDAAHAGAGDDHVFGEGGIDLIYGAEGDDYLDGGEGDDVLRGGLGDDILTGGSGNDILIGGLGNDILTGGTGEDIFKWVDQGADSGTDTIKDFTVGEDLIDLTEIISGFDDEMSMADLLGHIQVSENGDDLTLSITDDAGNAHDIVVEGAVTSFGLEDANFSNQSEVLTKLLNDQMFKLDDIT